MLKISRFIAVFLNSLATHLSRHMCLVRLIRSFPDRMTRDRTSTHVGRALELSVGDVLLFACARSLIG